MLFRSGELAIESGRATEARAHFARAAALSTSPYPDRASIMAKCYQALVEERGLGFPRLQAMVEAALRQAKELADVEVHARCLLNLARIQIEAGRTKEAIATLEPLPRDSQEPLGPELQAQLLYWHGRATAMNGDASTGESEATLGRDLLAKRRDSLSERFRSAFASRAEIRSILNDRVRISR